MVTRAAGLVIFRRRPAAAVEFLLLQTKYGKHHWTPPKGHVDPGESDWVTALRETREEAGLSEDDLNIYKDVTKTLNYEVDHKPKAVVYWLAKLKSSDCAVKLSDEHQDLRWLELTSAQELAGYKDMSDLLQEFHAQAVNL